MQFEITRDSSGNPTHVQTWDGFCHVSREFDPNKDGWMVEQLSSSEMVELDLIINAGRQAENLIREVNHLRRENWELRKRLDPSDLFGLSAKSAE
jgi:hypothetical protein